MMSVLSHILFRIAVVVTVFTGLPLEATPLSAPLSSLNWCLWTPSITEGGWIH